MNKNTQKPLLALIFAALLACRHTTPLCAQETAVTAESPEEYIYGTKSADILMADLAGFGLSFSAVGLNFLTGVLLGSDGEYSIADQMTASAVTELSSLPLFFAQSPDAWNQPLVGAALWAGELICAANIGLYSREQQWFYWAKNNLAMYRSYDAYASIRLRSPAWNNSSFTRHSSWNLMIAPFIPVNYAQPVLWGAVGITLAGMTGQWLAGQNAEAVSPLQSGLWYLDSEAVGPATYWFSHLLYVFSANTLGAIGEEAVYRGVLHEELSYHFGPAASYIAGTAAFALMHVITDLARGANWLDTLIHAGTVSINNILFTIAYDRGGMPLAVASHAAANFAGNILYAFLYAGAAQNRSSN